MTFPVDLFLIDNITMTDNTAVLSNDTRSLQYNARQLVGQRFEVSMTCRALPKNKKAAIGYLSSLRGGLTVETISVPEYFESDSGSKVVSTSLAIGVSSVPLQSATDVSIGDYCQFSGHTKIYCVTGISGDTLTIHPNLVRPVASQEVLNFNGIEMTVRSTNKTQSYDSPSRHHPIDIDINFVEVL